MWGFCSKSFNGCLGVKTHTPDKSLQPGPDLLVQPYPPFLLFSLSPVFQALPNVPSQVWMLGLYCAQRASSFSPLFKTPTPYAWAHVHMCTHTCKHLHAPYPFCDSSLLFETQLLRCLLCEAFSLLSQSDLGTSSSSLALPLHTSDEMHHFLVVIFSLQSLFKIFPWGRNHSYFIPVVSPASVPIDKSLLN